MWCNDVNMAKLILVRKIRQFILAQIDVYTAVQFKFQLNSLPDQNVTLHLKI